jgi:hypothetical protein
MSKCLSVVVVFIAVVACFSVLKAQDPEPLSTAPTLITNSLCKDQQNCKGCNLRVKTVNGVLWCVAVTCDTNLGQGFKVCVAGTSTDGSQKCKFTGFFTPNCNLDCKYFQCQQAVSGNCTLADPTSSGCTCQGQGTNYPPDGEGHGPVLPLCTDG